MPGVLLNEKSVVHPTARRRATAKGKWMYWLMA